MKLGLAIRELHRSECKLALQLRGTSARHKTDHEIHHVARDIAAWSDDHIYELAMAGRRHGMELTSDARTTPRAPALQQRLSIMLGRRSEPALLLLADLRRLHRTAAGVSLDWELLAQGAQAARDVELVRVVQIAHPQTLRQMRWANNMLKVLAPQVLA
ncbi:hypothetical protein HQO83_04115 [Rhodococcus fascians]|nr:hypothetical protein [Rhodococcus fascians]